MGAIASPDERRAFPSTVQDTSLHQDTCRRLFAGGSHMLLQLGVATLQHPRGDEAQHLLRRYLS